jgi:hypothetical protein
MVSIVLNMNSTTSSLPFVGLAWKSRKKRTWLFDFDAIQTAAAELGIRAPILIAPQEAGGRTQVTYGAHRIKKQPVRTPDGDTWTFHHGITVQRTCPVDKVSETIWHELVHAQQAEKVEDPTTFYSRHYKVHGGMGSYGPAYRANPYEIEARTIAAANAHRLLVKPIT